MADTKLTGLTATTSPATTDIMYVVTDPGTTPASKKVTIANLKTAMGITAPAMVQLSQTILSGTAASISFTTISGAYTNLQIVISGRGDNVGTSQGLTMTFNSDTGNNYDWQYIRAHGTTLVGAETLATSNLYVCDMPCAGAPAGAAGQATITIAGYAGSTYQKTFTAIGNLKVATTTGNIWIQQQTGWWRNTAAITTVTLALSTGNFAAGTIATLYGLT